MTTLNQADYPYSIEHLKKMGYEPVIHDGAWVYSCGNPTDGVWYVSGAGKGIYVHRDYSLFGCYIVRPIQKEKKLRPYTKEDFEAAVLDKGPYVRNRVGGSLRLINFVNKFSQITFISIEGYKSAFDTKTLSEEFTWPDGSPCGVEEEV